MGVTTRRVGVSVSVRVKLTVVVTDAVGAGLVRSTVGVSVAGSRVGIGACVGVEISVPFGRLINVGTAWVGVATNVGEEIIVAVAGRALNEGRIIMLANPTQYKTAMLINTMTKQP